MLSCLNITSPSSSYLSLQLSAVHGFLRSNHTGYAEEFCCARDVPDGLASRLALLAAAPQDLMAALHQAADGLASLREVQEG